MDNRNFLLMAWVIGLVSPALAEHRSDAAPMHLAFAELPLSAQRAQQIDGADVRLSVSLATAPSVTRPAIVASQPLAADVAFHSERSLHRVAHKRVGTVAPVLGATLMDGVQVGYEQLFPPPARHRDAADAAVATSPTGSGRETKIFTVFSGPRTIEGEANSARGFDASRAQGLLVALRAGF